MTISHRPVSKGIPLNHHHHQSSSHNKYQVVALTFANVILCLKSDILWELEVDQRSLGRLASGAHGSTTNMAVQSDMGWASFEVIEVKSKISFEERFRSRDKNKWVAKVHKCTC